MTHLYLIDNTLPCDLPDLYEGIEDNRPKRGRVLRTGLSSLRDRAANLRRRLAGSRFNPSREVTPEIDAALHKALRDSTEFRGLIE